MQGHQHVHYHHHRHLHLHLHLQTAVINDDLVEIALTFSALLGAFLCGLLSYLLSFVMLGDGWGIAAFVLGLLIGYFAMALALQVVNSGVAGIFVLWCVVCWVCDVRCMVCGQQDSSTLGRLERQRFMQLHTTHRPTRRHRAKEARKLKVHHGDVHEKLSSAWRECHPDLSTDDW